MEPDLLLLAQEPTCKVLVHRYVLLTEHGIRKAENKQAQISQLSQIILICFFSLLSSSSIRQDVFLCPRHCNMQTHTMETTTSAVGSISLAATSSKVADARQLSFQAQESEDFGRSWLLDEERLGGAM